MLELSFAHSLARNLGGLAWCDVNIIECLLLLGDDGVETDNLLQTRCITCLLTIINAKADLSLRLAINGLHNLTCSMVF